MMYLKQAPTQVAHGAAFRMGQSKANQWLHILLVALRDALHTLGDVPSQRLADLQHRMIDTTSDPAVAPFCMMAPSVPFRAAKTRMEQTRCYRGKKKRYPLQNVLLIHAVRQILFLSLTYEGGAHDKAIADATPSPLPDGSELVEDLGFLGDDLPGVRHTRLIKKPNRCRRTAAQKAFTRRVARRRIPIEHVISSIKRCRIVKDTIRLWKDGVRDLVMEVCCAVHNFRLRLNP